MTIHTARGSCRTSEWANNEEQVAALMPADVLRTEFHRVEAEDPTQNVQDEDLWHSLVGCIDLIESGPPEPHPFDPASLTVQIRKKLRRGSRVPASVAALFSPCQDAVLAPFAVMVRSNLGVDKTTPMSSHEDAVAQARELKVFDNHMVCVLHHGKRVARWDRVNADGGRAYGRQPPKENRWRRVPIDRPELVGQVREIWTIYLRNAEEVRAFNASCTVVQPE
ncbi:type IV pilus biogenesis protein PilI [Burkholderia cenocepacia]|uniref:type IV pilus biogenesis protein PilI n=1 Tax=Burkholderia cenocepacia TaxID=95486 RepID=UPI0013E0BF4E|nr:hypothetical protein [Burkholderia cenocepacia]MCW3587429.1 hypothetical protein [Burkholderia cenocepacia]MCW3633875.1 hypothetical protein [Burkholderia cenocepacia]MCW5184777.1 hypothetical protein [Burkholderia cenocepacia]